MKVLNLCYDDYANLAYNHTMALCSVGVEAVCYKRIKHPFGYEREGIITTRMAMKDVAPWADVVQVFHSWDFLLDPCFKNKKKVIWHTGTAYRQNPDRLNHMFNSFVDMTITDHCEFMHLGAKNIHYMAPAIDTDKIKPSGRVAKKPFKVGHYPSNPEVKGTREIIKMMEVVMKRHPGVFEFDCSAKVLPFDQNIERMKQCDIYIELFAPFQDGKEYGHYGVTAFEAAAAGIPCITQNKYPDVYASVYGTEPFFLCNSETAFMNRFKEIAEFSDPAYALQKFGSAMYTLTTKKHSYQATGQRLRNLLESI